MNLTSTIALRHLFNKNNNNFQRYSSIFSIIGISIGVCALILISSISEGFSKEINNKLSNIDGNLRIQSIFGNISNLNEFNNLSNKLANIDEIKLISPYIETHGLIKFEDQYEGIIVIGVNNNSLKKIFQLNNFTLNDKIELNKNQIIIGSELFNHSNLSINSELILFNLNDLQINKMINAFKVKVSNIFQTDFSEYDKRLVFINIKFLKDNHIIDNGYSGIIAKLMNGVDNNSIKTKIYDIIGDYPYYITTWEDRHSELIKWLSIYDVPIKIIMFFIVLIAIFNNSATLWIIVIKKTKNVGILSAIGMSKINIAKIIFKEGIIVGAIGSILGCFLSFIIILLQNYFHIINLPSEIYFMDTILFSINAYDFINYSLSAIILSAIFSLIPTLKILKLSLINSLRYE